LGGDCKAWGLVGWVDVGDCHVGEGGEHETMVNGEWSWFLQCTGQGVFVVKVDFGAEPDTVNAGVAYFLVKVRRHKIVPEGLCGCIYEPKLNEHINHSI
jgi:hypothetical protein